MARDSNGQRMSCARWLLESSPPETPMKKSKRKEKESGYSLLWCVLCSPNISFKNEHVMDHHMKSRHQGSLFDTENSA